MSGNLVNLNVNPCKMCMPMGAVSALLGVRSCMPMLHGSQGCATYIRRHMATHYNEPIDIASSALTEEGTVFGGEANLLAGLRNMIELYNPEVIGICTTCLAETIGEDVGAIVKKFYEQNPDANVKIINITSPGYGGTQNEGWFAAIRAILEQTEADTTAHNKINIITPLISPADSRWLKNFFAMAGIDCILLPDLSDNLDGSNEKHYNRLKTEGTSMSDIACMAGARLTLEFSEFNEAKYSPAEYLKETYGVPYVRLPLPVGVRGIDKLISVLADLDGTLTEKIKKERGRYLDAMIDAHKHNAEARVAVYGDPDFVAAMTRLCCENGAFIALAATGSVTPKLRETLQKEFDACKDYHLDCEITVMDDSDFAAIEDVCREKSVNLLIGSSDGRRISRKLNIPLIRCAFPIHDYIGGQRIRMLGFEGSLNILDSIANAMIEKTESSYRKDLYRKYYHLSHSNEGEASEVEPFEPITAAKDAPSGRAGKEIHYTGGYSAAYLYANIAAKTAAHPCFGEHACKNARVHLPVAPECNIQCNYCLRNYDCMNESRPGVASKVLTMAEALDRYIKLKETLPNLTVVGVAGPGDALASFEKTRETLRSIRNYDPEVTFCIATNGLLLPRYVPELKALGVSHVTVTVNAVDPVIGAKIYKHINYMGKTYTGIEGASILLANQLAGIKMLSDAGMICKVNCVMLKGINDHHVNEVTKSVAELGAFMANIMPHIPVKGSAFEGLERITNKEISVIREQCGVHIKQMTHCRQCRSDAVGTLDKDMSIELDELSKEERKVIKEEKLVSENRTHNGNMLRFAVATKGGTIVDTHFGQAEEFCIYESDAENVSFIEKREVSKYCNGPQCDNGIASNPEDKWESVIRAVSDCKAVLSLRIGPAPEKRLKETGIDVITTYEKVESAVKKAAAARLNPVKLDKVLA